MSDLQPSFDDRTDYENASRGWIASQTPCLIKAKNGRIIWNNDDYDFLQQNCPPTANAKLWRQGQLNSKQGLFEVTNGIYQMRGFDLSNMTIVEGQSGVIVIDPLVSNECAEAALDFYRQHRGDRVVTCLIYSHSHVDHFGGAQGVLSTTSDKTIPIIAPEGFMEEATSENVLAGPAMRRRAAYMYGNYLPKGPEGQIGCGLGMNVSKGTNSLIPPNLLIRKTGEEHVVDGVRIVFQMVPETEAPAEMNFYFPEHQALCIAECATHCQHNIITLRGALVRDAKAWAKYLDETIVLFGDKANVLFASHNWPTWGQSELVKVISEQRDLYLYLHDQTVRMMNLGLTGIEIAEKFELPLALQKAWHTQGFYGSVSHNVKGIYQRYMTWFDGNPANLWKHPPAEEGKRYIACMGGVDETIQKAKDFVNNGDLRFAATLVDHAIAAEPENMDAKALLADVFEKLGFGAENATWRNFYLTGARNLRIGLGSQQGTQKSLSELNPRLTIEQWFDGLSVQLDGPSAGNLSFTIDIFVPDQTRQWRLILSNGALTHRSAPLGNPSTGKVDLTLTLSKSELYKTLCGDTSIAKGRADGDFSLLHTLLSLLSVPRSNHL